MLAATVRAAGDIQLELLVESRHSPFEFLDHPSRKALRLGNRQLAELRAGAGNGSSPEGRSLHVQAEVFDFAPQRLRVLLADVDDQQVLHHRGAHFSAGKAVGELRHCVQLLAVEPAAQHRDADIEISRLLLRDGSRCDRDRDPRAGFLLLLCRVGIRAAGESRREKSRHSTHASETGTSTAPARGSGAARRHRGKFRQSTGPPEAPDSSQQRRPAAGQGAANWKARRPREGKSRAHHSHCACAAGRSVQYR